MPRVLSCLLLVVAFLPLACRLPPEREPLRSLPEDGMGLTYGELLARARTQIAMALDAFYLDNWKELEDVAKGLEQTARFLPRSSDPPASVKDEVLPRSKSLRNDSIRLAEAARTKNVNECSETLTNMNLHIRALRPLMTPLEK